MHDSGLGYRRIAKRLLDMNIKTARGSVFKNNNVYAVIKRYEERQVRLREERNRKYEHKWGKMYLTGPHPSSGTVHPLPENEVNFLNDGFCDFAFRLRAE